MDKQLSLAGKTILITGTSRGIGRITALTLADKGAYVILTARNEAKLRQLAEQIRANGGKAVAIPADLAEPQSLKSLADYVKKEYHSLDVLINNAGVAPAGPLEQTTTATWDYCMAVNARAPFLLCRELLSLLRRAQEAIIINISSVVGVKGYANQVAYTSSKHALRGMSMSLAAELKPQGIRVHVICPGAVNTDMIATVRPDIKTDELIDPAEIAELIEYLVTHKGNGIIDEIHIRRRSSNPWFS